MTPSMSAGEPPWWTGTIAFVRGRTAASIDAGSMSRVSGSTSTKTGTAPSISAALAVAMNVYGGTRTSSPAPTPTALRATERPIVALTVATAVARVVDGRELLLEPLHERPVDRSPDPGSKGFEQELLLLTPEDRPAARSARVRTGVPPSIASVAAALRVPRFGSSNDPRHRRFVDEHH